MSWFDALLDGSFGDDEESEAQRAWKEHGEADHEHHQARSELREAEERYAAAVSRFPRR